MDKCKVKNCKGEKTHNDVWISLEYNVMILKGFHMFNFDNPDQNKENVMKRMQYAYCKIKSNETKKLKNVHLHEGKQLSERKMWTKDKIFQFFAKEFEPELKITHHEKPRRLPSEQIKSCEMSLNTFHWTSDGKMDQFEKFLKRKLKKALERNVWHILHFVCYLNCKQCRKTFFFTGDEETLWMLFYEQKSRITLKKCPFINNLLFFGWPTVELFVTHQISLNYKKKNFKCIYVLISRYVM